MAELIELGAYRPGSSPLVDEAVARRPALEAVLAQGIEEAQGAGDPFARLAEALDVDWPAG
jgi:flagellum-specific ATP synthase